MSYQPELNVTTSRVICEPAALENISMRFKMSEEEWIHWSKDRELLTTAFLSQNPSAIDLISEQMEKQQKNTEREKDRKYDQQEYDADTALLDVVRNTFVSLCETLDKDELLSQIQKVQALIQSCVWGIGICEYGMTNQWKLAQLQDALQKRTAQQRRDNLEYNVTNSLFSFKEGPDEDERVMKIVS